MPDTIIMYTSNYCLHSKSVERFLKGNEIEVSYINIDQDGEARQRLIELNNGYASVPTLLFDDGSQLTEPSIGQLREKLGIPSPSFAEKIRDVFNK